jgi:ribosome biogenesis GTPase
LTLYAIVLGKMNIFVTMNKEIKKEATVISATGLWCEILTDTGDVIKCRIKGNMRIKGIKSTNPVAVGDRVVYTCDKEGNDGVITQVCDRRNYIVRRSVNLSKRTHILAANIDMAFVVVTLAMPATTTTFIDRILASCRAYGIDATLVFNKMDIYTPEGIDAVGELRELYEKIGYPTITTSTITGEGIDELREAMKDKTCMFTGHSGCGKSSLINAVEPSLDIRTGEISSTHAQGQHTTTFARMHLLSFGGAIIDTPGIRGFGMVDMKGAEVGDYFPEIFEIKDQCRFNNCTHTEEPGCAVLAAVEAGEIAMSRFESYLSILRGDEGPYREDIYK